mgnify:CR=1 FL=1
MPANCLFGAVLLWIFKGGRIRTMETWGSPLPHWYLECPDGSKWHYTRTHDLLPSLAGDVFFRGRFEEVTPDIWDRLSYYAGCKKLRREGRKTNLES